MSQFVVFAALLALLAVAFAISALWQRSRPLAIALSLALPLSALGLYAVTGVPAALTQQPAPAPAPAPTTMEDAIAQLEQRLASEPENFEGTALLARSYMAMEKFDLARDAYARALRMKPDETDVAVEYAESLLRTSADRSFPPEAVSLLTVALEKDPGNQRALFFLGLHQMHSGQPAEAAATWEKLLPLLPPETAGAVRAQIASARVAAGLPPLPGETGAVAPALLLEVRIDPAVARLAKPGAVVYVFARAVAGAGPPLAAKRIPVESLPLRVQLSDADSPMPAAKLFSQQQVFVVARLSNTGNVTAVSGDIESDPVKVDTTSTAPITLVLNRPVP